MPSCVMPVTCRCSEARRIGLPWPSRTPCRTSTKSRWASNCTTWIGSSLVKARMQGMLTAWSPPSTTGSAPALENLAHRRPRCWRGSRPCRCERCRRRRYRRCAPCPSAGRRRRPRGRRRRLAEGEQRRRLADGARAEARAGAPLRAEVEGRAEHRDIGIDRVPVEAERYLPKVQCPTKRRLSRPCS